jgi:Fusaric acid resistance protein-like
MAQSVAPPKPNGLFQVKAIVEQVVRKPPLLLGVLLEVIPVLYLVVYGKGSAAGVVILATLSLQMITLAGGLKIGAINAPIFVAMIALTCIVAGRPVAAGVLALIVALWASLGAASGRGVLISMPASIMTILIMTPPQITLGTNSHATRNVIAVAAYALLASCWGVAIGMLLRRGRSIPSIPGATFKWGMTQGLLVGVVMAGTAMYGTSRNLGQGGAWLLMTVFLVFKPLTPTPWVRSLNRAFGTLLGVGIVAVYLATLPPTSPPIALLVPSTLLLVAAALTLLAQRWPYWCFVALLTPSIVLLLACMSASTKVVSVARYLDVLRVEYSLLGIVIALAAQGLLIGITRLFRLETSTWFGQTARADPGGA